MGKMIRKYKLLFLLSALMLCSAGIIASVWSFYFNHEDILVADSTVPVYGSLESSWEPLPQETTFMLSNHDRVLIIKRIDVKHYVIYKVQLPNGQVGFINEGKYHTETK